MYVFLRAESGCGACTVWSDMEKGPVQHVAFLKMPGGTRQWQVPAAVSWEHWSRKEGCWGSSLPKTPIFSALILCDINSAREVLMEMFLKKYCLRCTTQHQAISIYLVLLVATLFDLWVILDLLKVDWRASCLSLLQMRLSWVHIPWERCGIARPDGSWAEK